jgi:hypothetical protein
MSPEQLRRMQAGRERAQREREVESVRRVGEYRRWLLAGSPSQRIPEVPSDGDYAVARRRAA